MGAAPEVVSMEASAAVPMAPRSPRPKLTLVREAPKPKKDKQKWPMLVCVSLGKHSTIEVQNKDKHSKMDTGKVVDLEAKEGAKDIDAKGIEPLQVARLYPLA